MRETPYYSMDLEQVERAYNALIDVLPPNSLHYCLKACADKALLRLLVKLDSRFEISSVGECRILSELGVDSGKTICGLPVVSDVVVAELQRAGIRQYVFDDLQSQSRLQSVAPGTRHILRLRVDDLDQTSTPFGIYHNLISQMIDCGRLNRENVHGLTFCIRPNVSIDTLLHALRRCEALIEKLSPVDSFVLNLGGNFRLPSEVSPNFYSALEDGLMSFGRPFEIKFQVELGRSIIKHACYLITRVVLVKKKSWGLEVFIDAGEPSGICHPPTEIERREEMALPHCTKVNSRFYGMTCSHRLLFEFELMFFPVVGDELVLKGMGAYSICMRNDFHSWERTPVVYESHGLN